MRPGPAGATLPLVLGLPIILAACAIGGVSAQCATVTVPEDRAQPAGRQISLRVAVLPATDRAVRRDDAVFYVTGGPGGIDYDSVPFVARAFPALNAHRDVVFVDQRGVGGSTPLACKLATLDADVAALVRACLGQVDADVGHYRTPDAMDDLEAVRQALGYGKIDLWGGSYGATAVQVFLRRHPESVRAVVIDGPTLLDVPVFERWSSSAQRALTLLDRRCRADAVCRATFPHWYERFPALLARLERRPVTVLGLRLDAATVADGVHELTASMDGAASVPFLLAQAEGGSYKPLARAIAGAGTDDGAIAVMPLAIMCTEPWAVRDPGRVAADAKGTYAAYADVPSALMMKRVCDAWPAVDTSGEDWTRVRSDVPALVLVGGSDPKDPPANSAGVTKVMPNAKVITVAGAGHGVAHLGCLPVVVDAFLERGSARGVDMSCVSLTPRPSFRLR